ncbi:MAG: hypothetical protein BHW32_08895 [Firmicutes bacterium CAG:129_59_24]|nr:MAG: hypothetical protein BHW32_08895 [Firmicutes bacterium CAG:129_59_24]
MAYMRLGDLLVSSSVITEQQLEKALTMQKETKERLTICMELTKKDEGCTLKHGIPRGAHAQGCGAELRTRLARPSELQSTVISRLKIMGGMNIAEHIAASLTLRGWSRRRSVWS